MKTRAQFAVEFLILMAFMFVVFIGFTSVITSKILETKENERQQIAEDLAALAEEEILIAESVNDGYVRTFSMPYKIDGSEYEIKIAGKRELVVDYADKEHVVFLEKEVEGNIGFGLNEIVKIDGVVYINNIEPKTECGDGLDNDGDGFCDLPTSTCTDGSTPGDDGCTGFLDNDETNCGDSICEGGENFFSCSAECAASTVFILKNLANNILTFTEDGNAFLDGSLTENADVVQLQPTADDEVIVKDDSGNVVARVNLITGNMFIKGTLNENQGSLGDPGTDDLRVRNVIGEGLGTIDNNGDFYLMGTLTQNP